MLDDGCQSLKTSYKFCSFKLSPIICENLLGYVEPVYDTLQEFDCCVLGDVYYWHSFHPLDKRVNGDK
jgi:hypothetical protein